MVLAADIGTAKSVSGYVPKGKSRCHVGMEKGWGQVLHYDITPI